MGRGASPQMKCSAEHARAPNGSSRAVGPRSPTQPPRESGRRAGLRRADIREWEDNALTGADFVASLRAKEPNARSALFDRYAFYVERVIVRTIGYDPEVSDLVPDVFLHAFECIDELREASALKGWIGRIAMYTALGFLRNRSIRRRWVRVMPFDKLPEPAAPLWRPEAREMLRHAFAVIDLLPAGER